MLEKMIIDTELVPLRDAAAKGDLPSLCTLARKIVEGTGAKPCPDILDEIYQLIMAHPDHGKQPYSALAALNILSACADLHCKRGDITEEEATDIVREVVTERIRYYASLPYEQWDLDVMHYGMEWLMIHEPDSEYQSPRN